MAPPAPGETSWTESVISNIGGNPSAGLLQAGSKFYGTQTAGAGGVFELQHGPDGWAASNLWTFPPDHYPSAFFGNVIAGVINLGGKLYGVANTELDALDGVAYLLTPPAPGQTSWSENDIWQFNGVPFDDGASPIANLLEVSGKFYGTTPFGGTNSCVKSYDGGCGTVFQLTPPAPGQTAWTNRCGGISAAPAMAPIPLLH